MWNMLLQAASFSVSDPRCPMWNCNLPRNRSDLPGDSRRSSADSETNRSRQYQNVTMWNHNPMKSRCSPRVLSVLQWFEKSDRDDRVVFRWETCSGQLRQQRLVSSRAEEAWISRVLIVFLCHNLCFLYVFYMFCLFSGELKKIQHVKSWLASIFFRELEHWKIIKVSVKVSDGVWSLEGFLEDWNPAGRDPRRCSRVRPGQKRGLSQHIAAIHCNQA